MEEDVQPLSTVASTKAGQPSMIEPSNSSDTTAPKSKKVVKLSPKEDMTLDQANTSEASVRVFYPSDNKMTQPDTDHYLVQVAALANEKHLLSTAADLPSNQPKWENVKTINNKNWHSLLFGNFETVKEAKDAILQLPASYQAMGPFVKSVKSIKSSQYPELKKLP
ncbi:DamX-related protein [Vibrio casei]|nr:DamX-related protein [Vibrio casei]